MGHGEHAIPGTDPDGPEGELKRIRPIRHADGIAEAEVVSEFLLECLDLPAKDVPAAVQDARDGLVDLGPMVAVLAARRRLRDG